MRITRNRWERALGAVMFASFLLQAGWAAAPSRHWPDETRHDADLHDVTFVDRDFGWAVGDRGTIWHTQDGGRHWQLQSSPAACPLWSVDFVDRAHGWAVGGTTLPYLHRGEGVVLRTTNGGQSWEAMPNAMLPMLFDCQFADRTQGSATSAASALFRDRGLMTSDGGRTWSGAPSPQGTLTSQILQQVATLPEPSGDLFDFATAAIVPGRVWVAGHPGSRVFRSDDGGETWEGFETGVRLPIHGMEFVDAQRGWAVGALGTILSTIDGGMTWSCQLGAGRRCAALVVAPSLDLVPYAAIAELAAVHGYRTHLLVVNAEPNDRPHHVETRVRLQEAMASLAAHGATYWDELESGTGSSSE
ncbi:MAG: YCF48-related protein, partial [Planctomycetota bacterium]